jgi:hypothetical protein
MKRLFFFASLILLLSCKKEAQDLAGFPVMESRQMLLICAEGNFRWNNAEAGLINLKTGEAEWKAFSKKNGRPLGDVLQSSALWRGKRWLVVNNSGRLEGLDPATFALQESITGLTSPRFIQAVSDVKAYCTDLYANKIWILKAGNSRPAGSINMPGWTEEMLFSGNRLWVLCRKKPWVLGINPQTDQVIDTITLPGNGCSLAASSGGNIWVSFEADAGSAPGIGLYHPDSAGIIRRWNGSAALPSPDRLQASASGDTLFFLYGGLCRIQANEESIFRYTLPAGNWYGLGLDKLRNRLFISDVKDYQQDSRILQLDYSGSVHKEWTGGIISSRFYFW